MILGLSESQDATLIHILFSDYYLIYLVFDKPIILKYQNIGMVFLPTVILERCAQGMMSAGWRYLHESECIWKKKQGSVVYIGYITV